MLLPCTGQQALMGWLFFVVLGILIPTISLAQSEEELATQVESSLVQPSEVTSPVQGKILLDSIHQSLEGDLTRLDTRYFVSVADAYGKLVAGAQEQGAGREYFEYLLSRGEGFYQRCRAKIRDLEHATGEHEAALEKLYRSDLWHDINYALSAFNYWQAWGKLGLAHSYQGEREQVTWLNQAEHGFQGSSVLILYPGIVYGSWLGMAYVAQARGSDALAEQRFRRLVLALSGDKDNSVRQRAETELTLLAIRKGELPELAPMLDEPLTPSTARVYQEQAFVLLQRQRDIQSGAIEAAARLKRVIALGYLNDTLLSRILSYRDEIVGHDIGLLSLYIDAEFAYAWQQYETAVFKYQAFRQQGGFDLPVNIRVLQYHYAVALLKIQLARDALNEVANLQQKTDLPQSVAQALPKLKFLIAQALYQRHDNRANRKLALAEAEYFLRLNPNDADAGSAHLLVAQLSDDPKRVKHHLKVAKQDKKLKGSIALTQIQRSISSFNRALIKGEAGALRSEAKKVLSALADLPRAKRKQPRFKAVSLQMRTVLGENLAKVLLEIDKMYANATANPENKKYALDQRVRRVLLWTQLRALDAYQQGKALVPFVSELASGPVNSMMQKEVYQFLLAKEQLQNYAQIFEIGDAFYPALEGQPQDQRQLRLLQIRAANALGESDRAYGIAQQLVTDFPDSGDAWVAFAESAGQMSRWFEAERAWAKITHGQAEGSPRWRDAMFKRFALLTVQAEDSDKTAEKEKTNIAFGLCGVLNRLGVYRHLMATGEQAELDENLKKQDCKITKE